MAKPFRQSALDRLASLEQLDAALTVTSPMSWLALAAVTVMIVARRPIYASNTGVRSIMFMLITPLRETTPCGFRPSAY